MQVDAGKMSEKVYNAAKLYGLSGVLNSPNAESVSRLYSHYDWYKKMGQVKRICPFSSEALHIYLRGYSG
jgi:hypothetical protein